MARPRFHALATAPLAALAYRRWGLPAALGVAAGGVFVDLDHLADYFWVRLSGQRGLFLAPLHAWELVGAGGALALWLRRRRRRSPPAGPLGAADAADPTDPKAPVAPPPTRRERLLGGLLAGLVLHLVQDVLTNRPRHPGVYALLYRLRHGFDRDLVGWKEHKAFHAWSGKPWYTWV